jgi:hypothetical protein
LIDIRLFSSTEAGCQPDSSREQPGAAGGAAAYQHMPCQTVVPSNDRQPAPARAAPDRRVAEARLPWRPDLLRKVGIGKNIQGNGADRLAFGGERQAVAVGRAMHCDGDLTLLDEPTDNLGPRRDAGRAPPRPQRALLRAFLHLHRAQHPPRLPGGGAHRR